MAGLLAGSLRRPPRASGRSPRHRPVCLDATWRPGMPPGNATPLAALRSSTPARPLPRGPGGHHGDTDLSWLRRRPSARRPDLLHLRTNLPRPARRRRRDHAAHGHAGVPAPGRRGTGGPAPATGPISPVVVRLAFPAGNVDVPAGTSLVLGRDPGESLVAAAFASYETCQGGTPRSRSATPGMRRSGTSTPPTAPCQRRPGAARHRSAHRRREQVRWAPTHRRSLPAGRPGFSRTASTGASSGPSPARPAAPRAGPPARPRAGTPSGQVAWVWPASPPAVRTSRQ